MKIPPCCKHTLLFCLLFGAPLQANDREEPSDIELAGHHALQRVIKEENQPVSEFVTDGCSGGLSSTWRLVARNFPDFAKAHSDSPPWEECCVVHDRSYHAGGFESSPQAGFENRLAADRALRSCVVSEGRKDVASLAAHYGTSEAEILSTYRSIGVAMFVAVRYGGMPCSGLPWRWGYGSPQCLVKPHDFDEK